MSQGPSGWSYRFPPLDDAEQALNDPFHISSNVEVQWQYLSYNVSQYQQPKLPCFNANVLVTNRRIVLLDRNGDPVRVKVSFRKPAFVFQGTETKLGSRRYREGPILLDNFWTLTSSVDGQFLTEFKNNPEKYSKGPLLASWWFHGYRRWTRAAKVRRTSGSPAGPTASRDLSGDDLTVTLALASVESALNREQDRPVYHYHGLVLLCFNSSAPDKTESLKRLIEGAVEEDNSLEAGKSQYVKTVEKTAIWIVVGFFMLFTGLPLVGLVLALLFHGCTSLLAPHSSNPPSSQIRTTNPGRIPLRAPSGAPAGSAWFGFANGIGVADRDAELVRNCGSFARVQVPASVGNRFSDLCAYQNEKCVRVCDWEGRNLSCDSVSQGGRRDATRIVFCETASGVPGSH